MPGPRLCTRTPLSSLCTLIHHVRILMRLRGFVLRLSPCNLTLKLKRDFGTESLSARRSGWKQVFFLIALQGVEVCINVYCRDVKVDVTPPPCPTSRSVCRCGLVCWRSRREDVRSGSFPSRQTTYDAPCHFTGHIYSRFHAKLCLF